MDQHAAACSERQSIETRILHQTARRGVGDLRWRQRAVANGATADFHGRRDVTLNQCRRNAQGIGDVVESFVGVVRRQNVCHIHIEVQQIANGICVFRAVQPMDGNRSRIRISSGSFVQARLQFGCKPIENGARGPRLTARRHHAGSHLPNDTFPNRGIFPDFLEIQFQYVHASGEIIGVMTFRTVLVDERRPRRYRSRGGLR